ncbi:MAG: PD-(D/E)XK nuclease family protein [Bacteroidota bacterium]
MILTKEKIKSIDLDKIIDQKIKKSDLDNFLIIVPTNRKLRSLKKEIISLTPNKVSTRINIETLSTLSKKLLEQTIDFYNLTEEASSVFIDQSSKKTELNYFTNYKKRIPAGTLDRISNVISRYKEEGIIPDLLRREAEKLNKGEKLKALDIANIYEEYNTKCSSLNAFELGDIYQSLTVLQKDKFDTNFRNIFNDVETILINGFNEFTQLELSIINKLSAINGIKLFINFDFYAYNSILFAHLEETYNDLNSLGFFKIEDASVVLESKFLNAVKGRLFLKSKDKKEERFFNKTFTISASSREKEVEYVAKELKQILESTETKPHEICVTCNLIDNYSSLFRDIFQVYGIPFNLTDRISLDKALSVTAIINFLEIAESDYYYKNILRSTSNSFIEIEEFDVSAFLFSARQLKIIIGRDNWNFNLKNAINALELDAEYNNNINKIENYKKTVSGLQKLDELLYPFQKKMYPLKFVDELNKLIQKLNIAPKLLNTLNENSENDIKSLTTFIRSVEEVFSLLASEEKMQKYDLSFYMDKIRTLSQSARFNIKERSDYGVLVTNIDEIRGLKFKHTFLMGMIDGDFPTKYQPEIFFSGSFRKKEKHHLNKERYRFYQSLKSWEQSLYLTYPLSDGEKETVKSTFLDEFEKSFQVTNKSEPDYNKQIFSTEELQRNIGIKDFPIEKIKDTKIESELKDWEEAVDIDRRRNADPFGESSYSGRIFSERENVHPEVKKKLEEMQTRAYSISQLETYTKCPFKYFLERVLRIEVIEEPDEEMEAVEIGSLLHAILFEFYLEIRNKNIVLKNCTDKVFKIAEDMIFKIAENQITQITKNSPYAFFEEEKIFGINSKREDSLLYRFLLNERKDETDRTPGYFEVSFGVKDNMHDDLLYSSNPLEFENVKLRGKVDRIDVNHKNKTFEVIDYKSGSKKVAKSEIEKGVSLQLPVYVWAVKTLLLNQFGEEYSPKAMTIYNLKYQENIFGKNSVSVGNSRASNFDPTPKINELVDNALDHVKKSVENILAGEFPLTPFYEEKDSICKYCHYNTICRIDELVK